MYMYMLRARLYYDMCAPLLRHVPFLTRPQFIAAACKQTDHMYVHIRDQNDNATYASTRWVPTVRHFLACENVAGGLVGNTSFSNRQSVGKDYCRPTTSVGESPDGKALSRPTYLSRPTVGRLKETLLTNFLLVLARTFPDRFSLTNLSWPTV